MVALLFGTWENMNFDSDVADPFTVTAATAPPFDIASACAAPRTRLRILTWLLWRAQ